MVLLGAPTSILFPHTEMVVPIPHFHSTVVPCWTFFPPGTGQFSSPFFLALVFFPISLPFLLSFCFSPSLSFIIYQFLFLFFFFPIFLCFLFCPLPRDYIPPLNCSWCSSPSSLRSSHPSVHIIMFLGFPA